MSSEDRESKAAAVAAEIAGGGGFEAIAGRVLPAAWIEAGRSVPVEENLRGAGRWPAEVSRGRVDRRR
jgi:hypothetical protein